MKPLRDMMDPGRIHGGQCLRYVLPANLFLLGLAGCSRAPSQDIVGSFFPAWMLCAALGVGAAGIARLLLGAAHLHKYLLAPAVGYLAFAVAVTLFVWLFRFG